MPSFTKSFGNIVDLMQNFIPIHFDVMFDKEFLGTIIK